MKKVTVYTTDYCPFCTKAKSLLDKYGIKYEEIDVTNDDKQREELIKKTGGKRTVPQIFIGDTNIGGFDDLSKKSEEQLKEMIEG